LLTKLIIRNFKRFNEVSIELGNPVVFIGPNNSGKSTALQALALWDIGLRRWNEARGGRETSGKRPGVAINRRDLIALPTPDANLLWRELHVRDVVRHEGKPTTKNVRVDIVVEGVTQDRVWSCGFEFDYANQESFYCRPLRLNEDKDPPRMPVPPEALGTVVAFLPPMSGLQDREFKKQTGEVSFLIGQ
jgi:energy-coupling factor transporter ATP-binding protein EcfA2